MKYDQLQPAQQRAVLNGRLQGEESEHFRLEVEMEIAQATSAPEDTIKQIKEQQAAKDAAIKVIVDRLAKLPADDTP